MCVQLTLCTLTMTLEMYCSSGFEEPDPQLAPTQEQDAVTPVFYSSFAGRSCHRPFGCASQLIGGVASILVHTVLNYMHNCAHMRAGYGQWCVVA